MCVDGEGGEGEGGETRRRIRGMNENMACEVRDSCWYPPAKHVLTIDHYFSIKSIQYIIVKAWKECCIRYNGTRGKVKRPTVQHEA